VIYIAIKYTVKKQTKNQQNKQSIKGAFLPRSLYITHTYIYHALTCLSDATQTVRLNHLKHFTSSIKLSHWHTRLMNNIRYFRKTGVQWVTLLAGNHVISWNVWKSEIIHIVAEIHRKAQTLLNMVLTHRAQMGYLHTTTNLVENNH